MEGQRLKIFHDFLGKHLYKNSTKVNKDRDNLKCMPLDDTVQITLDNTASLAEILDFEVPG
ncbi:MAG: hypothetical protein ACI8Y7_000952 [Candidatus Woesearchaeota archaeon]